MSYCSRKQIADKILIVTEVMCFVQGFYGNWLQHLEGCLYKRKPYSVNYSYMRRCQVSIAWFNHIPSPKSLPYVYRVKGFLGHRSLSVDVIFPLLTNHYFLLLSHICVQSEIQSCYKVVMAYRLRCRDARDHCIVTSYSVYYSHGK